MESGGAALSSPTLVSKAVPFSYRGGALFPSMMKVTSIESV
jgi:hypothetical protein